MARPRQYDSKRRRGSLRWLRTRLELENLETRLILAFGSFAFYGAPGTAGGAAVVVQDFNVDGWPDLATANFGSNDLSVWLNQGGGTFGAATTYPIGPGPLDIESVDLNGDGFPDLLSSLYNNGGPALLAVLLGNGAGGFGSWGILPLPGSGTARLTVGDMFQTGCNDVVTANSTSNSVAIVVCSTGAIGSFGIGSQQNPFSVELADLDGDGVLDVLVANRGSATPNSSGVSLLASSAGGAPFIFLPSQPTYQGFDAVPLDCDGSGTTDFAVIYTGPTSGVLEVWVNQGLPFPTFTPMPPFNLGPLGMQTGVDLEVADFDQTNSTPADLAVVDPIGGRLLFLPGNGNCTFSPPQVSNYFFGSAPSAVASGDFNLDNMPDFALAFSGAAGVGTGINLGNPLGPGGGSPGDFPSIVLTLREREENPTWMMIPCLEGKQPVFVGTQLGQDHLRVDWEDVSFLRHKVPAVTKGLFLPLWEAGDVWSTIG